MADDTPTAADVLARTLGEFARNEDWTYEATPEGANERHHGVRNPLGHTRQLANYRGDAAPEADDDR